MTLEQNPGTAPPVYVLFSNDAGTKLEVVCPSNPLPVAATVTPSGTQNVNQIQIDGTAVDVGAGASSSGTQRVILSTDSLLNLTPVKSTTFTSTQVTVPATANGILILAANANRLGATISNAGTVSVYVQQGATGVTTTNGFVIPGGSSYNIDEPLYTGAIYGIVATGTQVVTVVELT